MRLSTAIIIWSDTCRWLRCMQVEQYVNIFSSILHMQCACLHIYQVTFLASYVPHLIQRKKEICVLVDNLTMTEYNSIKKLSNWLSIMTCIVMTLGSATKENTNRCIIKKALKRLFSVYLMTFNERDSRHSILLVAFLYTNFRLECKGESFLSKIWAESRNYATLTVKLIVWRE